MNIVRPLLALIPLFSLESHVVLAQGSLTPPGPPARTMKSLDQIEARVPISSLPFVITNSGSYYVTTNLTGASGTNGITIYTNNVTIDLNGFTLVGNNSSDDGIAIGLVVSNICVRNGTLYGWPGNGVNLVGGDACLIEKIEASGNVGSGIGLANGVIRDCVASANGSGGLSSAAGITGFSCSIIDCVANNNLGNADGIFCNGDAVIVHCFASGNAADGISVVFGSTLIGCSSFNNKGRGIVTGEDSTIQNCTALQNTGDSISVTRDTLVLNNTANGSHSAGIHATFFRNRIEGNQVSHNSVGILIDAGATNNIVVRNSCFANPSSGSAGASNYVFKATTIFGPTNNVFDPSSGLITNVNPWANFSR